MEPAPIEWGHSYEAWVCTFQVPYVPPQCNSSRNYMVLPERQFSAAFGSLGSTNDQKKL